MKKFLKNWLLVTLILIASVLAVLAPVLLFTYLFGQTTSFVAFITMIILGFSFIVALDITFNREGH